MDTKHLEKRQNDNKVTKHNNKKYETATRLNTTREAK